MLPRKVLCSVILCVPVLFAAKHQRPTEPVLFTEPLGTEQTVIYRSFLASYLSDPANGSAAPLNVVLTTEAFNPSAEIHPDQACLWAEDIDNLATPQLHRLPALAIPSDRITLVDTAPPAVVPTSHSLSVPIPFVKHKQQAAPVAVAAVPLPATLLTLSEIVFNKEHTLAAFHYSYVCGDECGHGETLVYRLQGGVWKLAKAGCSKWVV